jgi:co-chaperonin GroES (HSP10)
MQILGNRVLAKLEVTHQIGRIFLPESAKDYYNTGGPKVFEVVAVGTGYRTKKGVQVPIDWCEPGDRILCHSLTNAPQESNLDRETFFITTDQILAVLPKPQQTQQAQ